MPSRAEACVVALAALLLVGCGGADSAREADRTAASIPSSQEIEFELEGWKTDFAKRSVPLTEFRSGGPPKDGIPPIDRPRFESTAKTTFLEPREPVIELVVRGEARAYPLQILTWHEIVNDTVAAVPVAVTFCPLCNTAIVFDRHVGGRTLSFGTTGKLRHSDLVMYDRQTESWWQQFGGKALVGANTGKRLTQLPAQIVSWGEFERKHPGGLVLTRDSGHDRPYGRNPYAGYDDADSPPIFPTPNLDDDRLPPKERVVFIQRGDESIAVPFSTLAKRRTIEVTVAGDPLVVRYRGGVASALDSESIADGRDVGAAEVLAAGKPVAFAEPFWFAVAAFDPDVRVIR